MSGFISRFAEVGVKATQASQDVQKTIRQSIEATKQATVTSATHVAQFVQPIAKSATAITNATAATATTKVAEDVSRSKRILLALPARLSGFGLRVTTRVMQDGPLSIPAAVIEANMQEFMNLLLDVIDKELPSPPGARALYGTAPETSDNKPADALEIFATRRVSALSEDGPYHPGRLPPPDPTLGAPSGAPYNGPKITMDDLTQAGYTTLGVISGKIVGGMIGQLQIPIPVVGLEVGELIGEAVGGFAGWAFYKLVVEK